MALIIFTVCVPLLFLAASVLILVSIAWTHKPISLGEFFREAVKELRLWLKGKTKSLGRKEK